MCHRRYLPFVLAASLFACGPSPPPACDDAQVAAMVLEIADELGLIRDTDAPALFENTRETESDATSRQCFSVLRNGASLEPMAYALQVDGARRARLDVRNTGTLPGCGADRVRDMLIATVGRAPIPLSASDRESARILESDRDPSATRRACLVWTDTMADDDEPGVFTLYWEDRDALRIGIRWTR